MSAPHESAVAALSSGNRDHELAAIVLLIRAKVIAMERLSALIEEFGSAVDVIRDVDRETAIASPFSSSNVEHALSSVALWRSTAMDVRTILDRSYPRNLLGVFNKPPLL